MAESVNVVRKVETFRTAEEAYHSRLSWRAILAGAAISLLTYVVFLSLGLAVAGGSLRDVIQGTDSGQGFGIGTGIWLIFPVLVSLFVGSYAAARVSGLVPIRVGRIQGVVIASLFFGFILMQVGAAVGMLGRGVGSVVGAAGDQAANIAQDPRVQDQLEQALGGLNLRSPPGEVARGLALRLIRGDTNGARNYLAREAGIPPAEAEQRIGRIQADVQRAAVDASMQATRVMQAAGWTLFGALVLGSLFAMLGGGLGARLNLRAPISEVDRKAIDRRRVA
jgi:hypothetical protein